MKRILTLALLACGIAAHAAHAADAPAPAAPAAAPDAPAAEGRSPDFARPLPWRVGYSLGYKLGEQVVRDMPALDLEAFNDGLSAAYGKGNRALTESEMQDTMEAFQSERMAEMQAARDKQAADNLVAGKAFLAKNGKRKGVVTTKSGLQYEVLKKGKGASPTMSDIVKAEYHGTFTDGTVFDSSRERGAPAEFALNRVIPGWVEGLQLMNKGAKFKFVLPPELAYGDQGVGDRIGPNAVLVFEVELLDFHAPAPEGEGQEDAPIDAQ